MLKKTEKKITTCTTRGLQAKCGPPSHIMWLKRVSKVYECLTPIHTRSICSAFAVLSLSRVETTLCPLHPNALQSTAAHCSEGELDRGLDRS